jgi:formamidopyrimidine-DNA glycosylase
MPELPEVETTRLGLAPLLRHQTITAVRIRQPRLRWPIPSDLSERLRGQTVHEVARRAKYLVLNMDRGALIVHLGMSGSLRVVPHSAPVKQHDHVDWFLSDGNCLRLHDPRRFGAVLWTSDDVASHPLLAPLGPEPLEDTFHGAWLYHCSRGRRTPVKALIMNPRIVVGVGNIYANEALFSAGIRPTRASGAISLRRYQELAAAIKQILAAAIELGGTTLRDFVNSAGSPGYFRQRLHVYGKNGQPCPLCGSSLRQLRVGQRSSVFCPRCQR